MKELYVHLSAVLGRVLDFALDTRTLRLDGTQMRSKLSSSTDYRDFFSHVSRRKSRVNRRTRRLLSHSLCFGLKEKRSKMSCTGEDTSASSVQ